MKVGSAVLTLCLLALLKLTLAKESCQKIHNITRSQLDSVPPRTPVKDIPLNVKCYSRCIIQDYFGENGKIDLKLVGNRASPREQRILGECKQKHDDIIDLDKCDYAYLMLQCLYLGMESGANAS